MESTAVAKRDSAEIIERVLAMGDLKELSPAQRTEYLKAVCESVGLNPLTRPFEYITLSGKLTLYARKDATEQLRRLHHVSVNIVSREQVGDVYTVTARATDAKGRTDESIGAVSIGGLKGDALCNAIMKAETKAKRRVTLSICGLGMLDEAELETIPQPVHQSAPPLSDAAEDAMAHMEDWPTKPVKQVKLVGVQPTSASEELLSLNRRLGYSEAQLLKWLVGKFNVDANLTLHSALGSLGDGELSQAIDIFRQRLEAK